MGPLGPRTHQTMIGVLGADDVRVTNNKITYEKETEGIFNGYTLYVTMNVGARSGRSQNITVNNNLIIKDSLTTGQGSAPFRVSNGMRNPSVTGWPMNLEMRDNVVMGSGSFSYNYAFIDGGDPMGQDLNFDNIFQGEISFTRTYR